MQTLVLMLHLLKCCAFCSALVICSHLGCIIALHKSQIFLLFKEEENIILWQFNLLNDFPRTAVLRPSASVCSVCDAAIIDVTFRPIVYSS